MTKKLSRILVLALSVLMILSMLAACGSSGEEKNNDVTTGGNAAEQSTVSNAAEELKPVVLKFYFPGESRPATDEVWKSVAEKTKDKLNAEFEINFVPFNDYVSKIQLLFASGDKYDMNFDASWIAYPQEVNKGACLDLKDLLPKYAPNYYKQLQDRNLIDAISVGGKILALPWTLTTNDHPFINIDMKKSGLEGEMDKPENNSIKTIEDLDAFLQKVSAALPKSHIFEWDAVDTYGKILAILAPKYNYAHPLDKLYGLTYKLDDPACKLVPVEQTDWYKEAVQWAKKWVKDGIIPKDLVINRDAHFNEPSNLKAVATTSNEYIYFDNTWNKPEVFYSELYPDGNYLRRSPLDNVEVINRNSENPERTLMFIDLLSSDQSIYDLVLYGIEGKTYVMKDGAYVYPDGMKPETSNYMDWMGQWAFWREGLMRPSASRTEEGWKAIAAFTNQPNSLVDPLTGFFPATDSIKNEIAKRTALTTELGKPLIYGIVKDSDKSLEEYVAKQKTSGTDKIIEEIQKQVDTYLAGKK